MIAATSVRASRFSIPASWLFPPSCSKPVRSFSSSAVTRSPSDKPSSVTDVLDSLPERGVAHDHPLAAQSIDPPQSSPPPPDAAPSPDPATAAPLPSPSASPSSGPPPTSVRALGRRKRSRAQVQLTPHFPPHPLRRPPATEFTIRVNHKPWLDYFPRPDHREDILRPFEVLAGTAPGQRVVDGAAAVEGRRLPVAWEVWARVEGGGVSGQAGAVRLGIARCLEKWNQEWRGVLKKDGLLTRDSREVESKKYGKRKARRSFQWVKR